METFYAHHVFVFLSLLHLVKAAATNITTDEDGLFALKAHVNLDPLNALSNNWTTGVSVCDWVGVTCGGFHNRVTALSLPNMGITGTIPPQMGNLSFLALLDLSNNSFQGSLPSELSNLRRLKQLHLGFNKFEGEIPFWVGLFSKLQILLLNANSFIGTIPYSICNISSLQTIDLSDNQLSGSIPSNIFNISSLRVIRLRDNLLSGSIPNAILKMSSLQNIDLNNNSLSGFLSENMFSHLHNLQELHLSYNHFHGKIPSSLFQCNQLIYLSLSVNNFTGGISKEIGNLTILQGLYLAYNNFQGPIPSEIGNLQNLEVLSFSGNNLAGPIPPAIFNISAMKVLAVTANYELSGSLPPNIGFMLPNLQQLLLGGNMFSGVLPSSISNASKLTYLDLVYNSFSGSIPDTLGKLKLLQWLSLGGNNFTSELSFLSTLTSCRNLMTLIVSENPLISGTLPNSIVNLSASLNEFSVAKCNINGRIPQGIGNLSNLTVLHLEGNKLSGPIPTTIGKLQYLQGLYLQNNDLGGSVPVDICQLKSLVELDTSGNKLTGSVPTCFGKLVSLRSLSLASNMLTSAIPSTLWSLEDILHLNLSSNSLSGTLPLDIGNLRVVTDIDLSRNQLSGKIPTTIGGLKDLSNLSLADNSLEGPIPESLGYLTSLESLDLSSNNLSGVIPKSMEALSYLRHFNVSSNRLQGEIPTKGPFQNFSAQSFLNNDELCGPLRFLVPPCRTISSGHSKKSTVLLKYILPILVSLLVLALALTLLLRRYRKREVTAPTQVQTSPIRKWRRISSQELHQATNGFSKDNLIGLGSFGSVYKGTLADGTIVAIKVFDLQCEGAFKSFDAECEVLRNLRHRNLVKIISICSTGDFKALILEYMPNGSLEKWLYSENSNLDILQRVEIALNIASALDYLHHGYFSPVIHCDIKPSNVLLGEDMVAHLSDFGITRLLGEGESVMQTQTLATIGYMAPEHGREGKVSREGDVYSYGIMLMEIFTRKQPTDELFVGEMSLKFWVSEALLHDSILEIVDSGLVEREDVHFNTKIQCLSYILNLAMDCTRDTPDARISMKEVGTRLENIRNILGNI